MICDVIMRIHFFHDALSPPPSLLPRPPSLTLCSLLGSPRMLPAAIFFFLKFYSLYSLRGRGGILNLSPSATLPSVIAACNISSPLYLSLSLPLLPSLHLTGSVGWL